MTTEAIKRLAGIGMTLLFITPAFSNIIDNTQYQKLQSELNRYYDIASAGGWGKITLDRTYYMRGQSAPLIRQVKQRLKLSGDYTSSDQTDLFTEDLAAVIKKVRKQFGLPLISSVDAPLIKELNVPVQKRIAQLESNIERLRNLKVAGNGTHLVANVPEFKLHVYENGTEVFDMDIVVGGESTKTVMFNGNLSTIVFSPYWNVPASIVRNEILPAMRSNKSYLQNNSYEVVGNEGGLPAIRQRPGAANSLGRVKFVFPNSHSIYFHDTPAKSLFKMERRAFSHGCIRLAEPTKLAEYLLRNQPSWTSAKIRNAMQSGREQPVKMNGSIPVSIVYITAWVDDDGTLNFRDDIYGRDKGTASNKYRVAKN